MNIDGLLLCSKCENQLRVRPYSGNHGFFVVDSCTHCAKVTVSKISNDDLSYLIVRSLTEGEIIETIDEVDRDIIDDMADTDRQIILNFLEKYRPSPPNNGLEPTEQSSIAKQSYQSAAQAG